MTATVIRTPAKLNLGLEITGRRPDGYHDVVTILQAISLWDDVVVQPERGISLVTDRPDVPTDGNLAVAAVRAIQHVATLPVGARISLTKRIPVAAGLGGASSDAAATLLAIRTHHRLAITDDQLLTLAAGLGSDVPFFLRGGTALATGRGDELTPLPTSEGCWFVVVSPRVTIPRKTATLYAALSPADFTTGETVRRQAAQLAEGQRIDSDLLGNAFTRPLYRLVPDLATIPETMHGAGAPVVALSGAGPSHYTIVVEEARANALAHRLGDRLGTSAEISVCQPVGGALKVTEV